MGFQTVRYTHGSLEYGKDLVFSKIDNFGDKEWYGAQIKTRTLDGSASGAASLRTICNQIQQALDTPFTDID